MGRNDPQGVRGDAFLNLLRAIHQRQQPLGNFCEFLSRKSSLLEFTCGVAQLRRAEHSRYSRKLVRPFDDSLPVVTGKRRAKSGAFFREAR